MGRIVQKWLYVIRRYLHVVKRALPRQFSKSITVISSLIGLIMFYVLVKGLTKSRFILLADEALIDTLTFFPVWMWILIVIAVCYFSIRKWQTFKIIIALLYTVILALGIIPLFV